MGTKLTLSGFFRWNYKRLLKRKKFQKNGSTVMPLFYKYLDVNDKWVAALYDFLDDSVDSFILDQLIDNCLSRKLRTNLLAERDLNLGCAWILLKQSKLRKVNRDRSSRIINSRCTVLITKLYCGFFQFV